MLQVLVDLGGFTPIWNSYLAKKPVAARRLAEELAQEIEAKMKRRRPPM